MRRFAGHARPDLLAIRAAARAKGVCTGEENHSDEDRLQHRYKYQSSNERRVSKVDGTNSRLNHRYVLTIELEDVIANLL